MRLFSACCTGFVTVLLLPGLGSAQAAMTDAQFIAAAEGGAPATISAKAAIVRIDPAKKAVTQLRAGTNGFTCGIIPDESKAPFCGDKNASAWFVAAFTGQPKPPNTAPGISYMAQGGTHYETASGAIVMEAGAGTKSVGEPPHWMLMWPIDAAASGLPTRPNPSGVYIMFAGTPFAHVMIYQNPNEMMK
jgi:hypothetical protein